MQFGLLNQAAPELRVPYWIDPDGNERGALTLDQMGDGFKLLFNFQDWCPGCHSRGFPTLKKIVDAAPAQITGYGVIQTVFEGAEQNGPEKLRLNQTRYGLDIPFGHDPTREGERHPTFMEDYRSGGTPWFTLIDPNGTVVFADFGLDADKLLKAFSAETL